MKKILYILITIPFISFAQITVTQVNLPAIGDTVITSVDSSGNFTPGSSGVNQNWNFSNLAGGIDMVLGFIDPAITPYSSTFPGSNLCVKIDANSFYYLKTNVNGLSSVGFVDMGSVYPWNKMLLPTPLNYLDTITYNQVLYEFDTVISPPIPAILAGIPGPYVIDSIKQVMGSEDQYIVDAWGQIQLPNGTFDALRVFETSYEYESVSYRLKDTLTGVYSWLQDPNSSAIYWNESRYSFRTNDSTVNWSLAVMEADSLGNTYGDVEYYLGNSINNIVISPPIVDVDKIVDVSCNGYADGFIMLDIFGTAAPLSFSWVGPNNFSSNNQDIFNLDAGNYTVTVIDTNGNSTTQTYIIYEPTALIASINQSGINLTVNVNGGTPPYSYLWSTGTPDTLSTLTPSANGLYMCDVTDKAGCQVTTTFNVINIPSSISDINSNKKIVRVVDLIGREDNRLNNGFLLYYFDDGTIEKKILIE